MTLSFLKLGKRLFSMWRKPEPWLRHTNRIKENLEEKRAEYSLGSFLIDDMMMKKGLGLSGCELLLFALIASYSRKGFPMFESAESLSHRLPYSRKQIGRALHILCSKGYIIRSIHKHRGCQSYDYKVNDEVVRQNVPSWCDKTTHHDVTKSPNSMGTNVSSGMDNMSHNNGMDNLNNNERDNELNRAPFIYFILNRKWETLVQQPKWVNKTTDQFQIAIERIKSQPPPIAMEMMNYTISHGYPDIYTPKTQIIEDGEALAGKYLEDERRLRKPQIVEMLDRLHEIAPKELKVYMPGIKHCEMLFGKLILTCPEPVSRWIDDNLEKTKPIVMGLFPGFTLHYRLLNGNECSHNA